jgi:aubergine-like protein
LRRKIIHSSNENISKILGHYIFNNSTLYSLENCTELIEVMNEVHGMAYKVKIKSTNTIEDNSFEAESIYKKFIGIMLKNLKFIQFRKNFYNNKNARHFQNFKDIEIWPGFNSTVNILQEGILLNMSLTYKLIRTETALSAIENISNKNQKCSPEEINILINEHFRFTSVLTRYNGDKIYLIDEVNLKLSPRSTFDTKDGPISYQEYYKQKYGLKLNFLDQPLFVIQDKKRNQIIHLIPELCYLSGLTDEMRSNFNLMKDVATITKGNVGEKMEECRNIINQFIKNSSCQSEIKKWGITLSNKPLALDGYRLSAGNYVMHKKQDGSRHNFSIDDNNDIDRKIQAEMFSQPPLNVWAIFATQKDENLANTFLETIKQVQSTFNYQMNKPPIFLVKSQNFRDWENELSKNINPNVQAVVLIIPGSRGKGPLYNDLKRLLLGKYPVPSQVVLSGTLSKGIYYILLK